MKKIIVFPILLILITLLSCNVKAPQVKNIYKSELENKTWKTNKILGLDTSIKHYHLKKFDKERFGNLISFSDGMNYKSWYTARCGNDNFTTVNGKYKFFDTNKIKIIVDSVIYTGEWKKSPEYRKPTNLIYLISKTENNIILTKQEN